MKYIYAIVPLFVFLLIVMLLRATGKHVGPTYRGVLAGIGLYYTIVPALILIMINPKDTDTSILLSSIKNVDAFSLCVSQLFVLSFIFSFVIAYSAKHRNNTNKVRLNEAYMLKSTAMTSIRRIGRTCFIFGGISLMVYAFGFGGIKEAIRFAGMIRYFTVDAKYYVGYFASIMIIPAALISVAPWCYLMCNEQSRNRRCLIMFAVSYAGGILFYLLKAGRAPLLIFILGLCMPILLQNSKKPWLIAIIVSSLALPILNILDMLFEHQPIMNTIQNYSFTQTIKQFAYPYSTLLNIFEIIRDYGLRWGQDLVTPIISLFPGINFDVCYELVSEYYGGTGWRLTGSVPTDLLSFSILQFYILGPVVFGIFMGRFLRRVDGAFFTLKEGYSKNAVESILVFSLIWFVSTADFDSLLRTVLLIGLCLVLIYITKKKEIIHESNALL